MKRHYSQTATVETGEINSIQIRYNMFILPLRFTDGEETITCWLPLTNREPSNKKYKDGKNLTLRSRQRGRGGYYQMSDGGKSVHVHMYEQKYGITRDESLWQYHISHLCHHWWCCNPNHLTREPDWVNILRKSDLFTNRQCICCLVKHPLLPFPPKKCIWYNSKAKATLDICDSNMLVPSCIQLSDHDCVRFLNYQNSMDEIKQLVNT